MTDPLDDPINARDAAPATGAAPAAPPRRGSDDRWLCNAVAGCDQPAVIQWAAADPTAEDPGRTVPVFACGDHPPA